HRTTGLHRRRDRPRRRTRPPDHERHRAARRRLKRLLRLRPHSNRKEHPMTIADQLGLVGRLTEELEFFKAQRKKLDAKGTRGDDGKFAEADRLVDEAKEALDAVKVDLPKGALK